MARASQWGGKGKEVGRIIVVRAPSLVRQGLGEVVGRPLEWGKVVEGKGKVGGRVKGSLTPAPTSYNSTTFDLPAT